MIKDEPESAGKKTYLWQWFIGGGVAGLTVAFLILASGLWIFPFVFLFWPGLCFFDYDDANALNQFFVFSSNFLLYGFAGLLIGLFVRSRRTEA